VDDCFIDSSNDLANVFSVFRSKRKRFAGAAGDCHVVTRPSSQITPVPRRITSARWSDGWKVVFERADRVVVFMVTPVRKSGCEVTFVQTVAYRPADYEEKVADPRNPEPPHIP
jgi:hypothetical protein